MSSFRETLTHALHAGKDIGVDLLHLDPAAATLRLIEEVHDLTHPAHHAPEISKRPDPGADRASVEKAALVPATGSFAGDVVTVFSRLDRDRKGYATLKDIDQAILTDHDIKGEQAAALFVLKSNFGSIGSKSDDGSVHVSLENIKNLSSSVASHTDGDMHRATEFLKEVNRGLYPSGQPEQSLAKMRDSVHQSHRGNCYFASGLSSLASVDPGSLQNEIKDNGVDTRGVHTYTVTFNRAPNEHYTVDDYTDAGLLVNDVDKDSGTWMSVLERAYGEYEQEHPLVRFPQRLFYGLNGSTLPEDLTDNGSQGSDGLYMNTSPDTRLTQTLWSLSHNGIRDQIADVLIKGRDSVEGLAGTYANLGRVLGPIAKAIVTLAGKADNEFLRETVADKLAYIGEGFMRQFIFKPRDLAATAAQLEKTICQQHQPATLTKYDGAHEASVINYEPGTVSKDGKHTSTFGFVTVRDQIGLSGDEQSKVESGQWWREPGNDGNSCTMSVEDFVNYYNGFSVIEKK